ncbi:hypothetical protein DFAR_1780003 [Desulfarculales bacterium]
MFFCALHPMKPLAHRQFDQKDYRRGRLYRSYDLPS